jgi:hydrogenase nickel incorporation protein HypA/HybF
MHELSIAHGLVELVCDELMHESAARVRAVRLRVGPLSGVVAEALRFAYDAAAAGTALEGSILQIEHVTPAVFCPACRAERELAAVQPLRCPVCLTPTPDVVRGRELEVASVELMEPSTAPGDVAARPV